ncbi:GDSL-type esterase/lipase family protein [Streptomyces sp. NRRL S-31]|uniref:SGNH/GDSL hydrolase family protein n=1 Tax=Streptomyces sp. NRRL S-31 TaxID=1463898 RepID=UPI00055BE28B|nr:GDSL-type esterase/lipase family protein [Streptomyces sp. NRRL S-31]
MRLRRYELTPQMQQYDDFDDPGMTRHLPYLMYFHRADYRSEVLNTDRLGFRISRGATGHASADRPPEGPVRLFVGSSTAFGIGATGDATTIPSRLWSRYAPSVPWLNFGGRSYNSTQELLLFTLHQHLLPPVEDIVIMSGFNNLALSRLPAAQQGEHGAFFYCGEYYEQMAELRRRHRKVRPGFGRRAGDKQPTGEDAGSAVPGTPELISRAVELTARHLAVWRRLATATGARVSFVLQPLATWVREEPAEQEAALFKELDKMSRLGIFEDLFGDIVTMETGRAYADALRVACEKQDVAFVDLNPALAGAATTKDWLYVDRAHCTDHGYDLTARLLADHLDLR